MHICKHEHLIQYSYFSSLSGRPIVVCLNALRTYIAFAQHCFYWDRRTSHLSVLLADSNRGCSDEASSPSSDIAKYSSVY